MAYLYRVATESLPERAPPSSADRSHVEPRRGMRLGRYELLMPLARGGMAEVWIARQTGELGFRRLVAVKTIRPEHAESPGFRRMFLDEARLAARIRHANVVEVLDLGEEGPMVYQAMTLIEGDSLAGLLRRWHSTGHAGGLPTAIVLRVMADAASGLHAAHELTDEDGAPMHLVHRDVSPHNILIGVDGVAKLADFGIAKALGRSSDETEAGQMKGKFSYLSPEQVLRQSPDRRSDVFASGIVLWEMLTGTRLFRGADVMETLEMVRAMRIPDLREISPDIDPAIADVTARALARLPSERIASAAELSDALEEAARRSSAVATTKDVANFVVDLVGDEVEQRREGVREVTRGSASGGASARGRGGEMFHSVATPETVAGTTIADSMSVHTEPRRSPRVMLLATALAALAAVAGSVIVVQTRLASQAPTSIATAAASMITPAMATAAAVESSVPSASATATESATVKRPASRVPTARPAVSAPPKPKFGNPYGP